MRTSAKELRQLLQLPDDMAVDIYIQGAELVVDRVVACDTGNLNSASVLARMELYLAAEQFESSPEGRQYQSRSELTASATFEKRKTWREHAIEIDRSGCLSGLDKKKPQLLWLGKPLT